MKKMLLASIYRMTDEEGYSVHATKKQKKSYRDAKAKKVRDTLSKLEDELRQVKAEVESKSDQELSDKYCYTAGSSAESPQNVLNFADSVSFAIKK